MTVADKVLAGRPESVGQARAWISRYLDGFPAVDEALLATSEFVTNAVLHSRSGLEGGKVRVRIEVTPGAYVRIEVRDDGPGFDPARTVRAAGLDENGHGLFLVGRLAELWGTDGHGMCWCRFLWPAIVPGPAAADADDGALFALPAGGVW